MVKVGDNAPDFESTLDDGSKFRLSSVFGNIIVLYFYPKDNTPGCTKEACNIRDNLGILKEKGILVYGVSTDSVNSHSKFKLKYNLNFPLISDDKKEISSMYGVLGPFGTSKRVTFLIGRDGIVKHIWGKVDVSNHANQILQKVEELGIS